jgi:hypothetical protein
MMTRHRSGIQSTAFILGTFFTIAAVACAGTYSGGSGTAGDPYKISTTADWAELAATPDDWNGSFVLTNDIDFAGVPLVPVAGGIDTDMYSGPAFNGGFDGGGHVLRNAVFEMESLFFVGLFGNIGSGALVENLLIGDIEIRGYKVLGGLCGFNSGTIRNCTVLGSVNGSWAGGLCGKNQGSILDCSVFGQVNCGDYAEGYVGGLVGLNEDGSIGHCFSDASVSVGAAVGAVGGLCGGSVEGLITFCNAAGEVWGNYASDLGGLCGTCRKSDIQDCFATGAVIGANKSDLLGGLCGRNEDGTIFHCYATGSVAAGSYSGYIGGLCGSNNRIISDCYATGDVQTDIIETHAIGGLCGQNIFGGSILRCRAEGDVSGEICGGLVGKNDGTIESCTAFGAVAGADYLGGLCSENSGTISDCTVSGVELKADYVAGGLVAYNSFGILTDCHATAKISCSGEGGGLVGWNYFGTIQSCTAASNIFGLNAYYAGGLVGLNAYGTIVSCSATGTVTGYKYVGGLVGDNQEGTITNSCAIGSGSSVSDWTVIGLNFTGGLVGDSSMGGFISGCFALHAIQSISDGCSDNANPAGGLVGYNWSTISNCYARGKVFGYAGDRTSSVGGLVGISRGSISNCYSSVELTDWEHDCCEPEPCSGVCSCWIVYSAGHPLVGYGDARASFWDSSKSYGASGGEVGPGTDITPAQFKTKSIFTDAGWDFVGETANGTADVWRMCGDGAGYPRLAWEFSQGGDMDCPDGVGLEDFLYFARHWLAETPETVGAADADGSGKVDLGDFAILATHWLEGQ